MARPRRDSAWLLRRLMVDSCSEAVAERLSGKGEVDIAAWLRGLGLERYELVFRDNEIDAAVLPELTDEHLKELGLPLGPRLKLLKAIAALCAEPPPAGEAPSAAVAVRIAGGEEQGPRAP